MGTGYISSLHGGLFCFLRNFVWILHCEMMLFTLLALAALPGGNALLLRDNVGRLPALGWNSWNAYHCDVDESKIMAAANQVVKLGLKDVGYEYINSTFPLMPSIKIP